MNVPNNYPELTQKTANFAIDRWENEGGAHGQESPDLRRGRRVEADRSRTVYHVFRGAPARINGNTMVGLSQGAATDGMLSLNRRNQARRRDRGSPIARNRTPRTTGECRR
jgi:hypothetical protein